MYDDDDCSTIAVVLAYRATILTFMHHIAVMPTGCRQCHIAVMIAYAISIIVLSSAANARKTGASPRIWKQ